jgi:hypothetical protein
VGMNFKHPDGEIDWEFHRWPERAGCCRMIW